MYILANNVAIKSTNLVACTYLYKKPNFSKSVYSFELNCYVYKIDECLSELFPYDVHSR